MSKIEEIIFEKPEEPYYYNYMILIEYKDDNLYLKISNLTSNELIREYESDRAITASIEIYFKNIQVGHIISSEKYNVLLFNINKVIVVKRKNEYIDEVKVYLDDKKLV